MRNADTQFKINSEILEENVKKLQTSLNYLKEDFAKGTSNNIHLNHASDDALTLFLSIEKFMLLKMMVSHDDPDERYG